MAMHMKALAIQEITHRRVLGSIPTTTSTAMTLTLVKSQSTLLSTSTLPPSTFNEKNVNVPDAKLFQYGAHRLACHIWPPMARLFAGGLAL